MTIARLTRDGRGELITANNDDGERLLSQIIQQRIAHFDSAAAQQAADTMADRQRNGRSGDLRDTMIAGIALASHATIATRNVRHFEDLACPVVDPWNA